MNITLLRADAYTKVVTGERLNDSTKVEDVLPRIAEDIQANYYLGVEQNEGMRIYDLKLLFSDRATMVVPGWFRDWKDENVSDIIKHAYSKLASESVFELGTHASGAWSRVQQSKGGYEIDVCDINNVNITIDNRANKESIPIETLTTGTRVVRVEDTGYLAMDEITQSEEESNIDTNNARYTSQYRLPQYSKSIYAIYPSDLAIRASEYKKDILVFIDGLWVPHIEFKYNILIKDGASKWASAKYESIVIWDLSYLGNIEIYPLKDHKTIKWDNGVCTIGKLPHMESKPLLFIKGKLYAFEPWYTLISPTALVLEGFILDELVREHGTSLFNQEDSALIYLPKHVYKHEDTIQVSSRLNEYVSYKEMYKNPLLLTEDNRVIPYTRLDTNQTSPQYGKSTYVIDEAAIRVNRDSYEVGDRGTTRASTEEKVVLDKYGMPTKELRTLTLYKHFG